MNLTGCEILVYPGAFNMSTGPLHWELLARSRANDNQLFVAAVSVARDESADYIAWGHSMIVDPWGKVVDRLNEKEGLFVVDMGKNKVHASRAHLIITCSL